MLAVAVDSGYRIISVEDWAAIGQTEVVNIPPKLLILRHDVDTDPAQMMLSSDIEREFNAGASYFFRLSTMHPRVVDALAERGFHVSYHFEELATFAKKNRLKHRAQVETRMSEIQDLFAANVTGLRKQFGLPMRLVCSHGDWVNRRLGIMNHAILASRDFRAQIGVDFETYDDELVNPMKAYVSDYPAPFWWKPAAPQSRLRLGESPLGVLTHPRQWQSSIHNATDIAQRIVEGLYYQWR